MSMKSARSFIDRMKEDENLWELHTKAKSKEERHNIIKNAGFDFTDDELKTIVDDIILRVFKRNKFLRQN